MAIHVHPRARRSEIAGLHDQALKIRLQAPPVDGKANQALLKFLAAQLDLPSSAFTLVTGHRHRRKLLQVSGITVAEVRKRLVIPAPCP